MLKNLTNERFYFSLYLLNNTDSQKGKPNLTGRISNIFLVSYFVLKNRMVTTDVFLKVSFKNFTENIIVLLWFGAPVGPTTVIPWFTSVILLPITVKPELDPAVLEAVAPVAIVVAAWVELLYIPNVFW